MRHPLPVSALIVAASLAACQDTRIPMQPEPAALRVEPAGGGFSGQMAFDRIGAGMVVMNADGSEQRVITRQCRRPDWSPDGREIACVSGTDVYTMNADGSWLANRTAHPALDINPAWSNSGAQIAFVSNRDGSGCEVYVMERDGNAVTQLTTSDYPCDMSLTWSPDDARIAFHARANFSVSPEIYVINADGSGLTNLTNYPGWDSAPAWSPDGLRIAFIRDRTQGGDLFVMNADGSGVTQITSGIGVGAESGRLTWSPDGRRVAFEGYQDFVNRIFVTKVDTPGAIEQVTANADGGFGDILPDWTWRRP